MRARPDAPGIARSAAPHLAYVLGLSFTNHMSTLYLAPAFLLLYFIRRGASREGWLFLLRLVPAFCLGLSVYLFLPVRASSGPMMNWGNPAGFDAILRHLSGKQYSVWIFSSSETAVRQLAYFFRSIGAEFFYVPLVVARPGTLPSEPGPLILIVLLFAGCLAFAVNRDINDIDSYFCWRISHRARLAGMYQSSPRSGDGVPRSWLYRCCSAGRPSEPIPSPIRATFALWTSTLGDSHAAEPGGIVISYQWTLRIGVVLFRS